LLLEITRETFQLISCLPNRKNKSTLKSHAAVITQLCLEISQVTRPVESVPDPSGYQPVATLFFLSLGNTTIQCKDE